MFANITRSEIMAIMGVSQSFILAYTRCLPTKPSKSYFIFQLPAYPLFSLVRVCNQIDKDQGKSSNNVI